MEKVITITRNLKWFQNTYILILICCIGSTITYGQVEVPLKKRTALTLKGDFKFVSNTVLGKVSNDDGSGIFDPNKSYNDGGLNNQFKMGFIDIDNDPTTFNSSSADLNIDSNCNAIKHVGLYWTAAYADDNRQHDITSIKIKYPGQKQYSIISEGQIIHDYYKDSESLFQQYSCYKDITKDVLNLKDPLGTYTVANIPATTSSVNDDDTLGNGLAGGWTMVVIYEDDTKPRKKFYVYDGFVNIDSKAKPVAFSFNNFQTIPNGAVHGKIGVIAYEGDKGIIGDRFQVMSNETNRYKSLADGINPMNNFFNANITENGKNVKSRVPASQNTLGYDADLFDIKNVRNSIIGNNQTEAKFRLSTNNDGYSVMAVAFSVEIYEPAIHIVKRSKYTASNQYIHPDDVLAPKQEITYNLTIYNDGNDDAKNTIIKDVLPKNVIFSEKTLVLPTKRVKVKYDKTSRTLNFIVPNKMVRTDSEPFKISYNVIVDTGCESINTIDDILVVDQPVTAEFNGTLNETIKYSKGYNHINSCKLPDYYQFKLAIDISSLNCPNANRLVSIPKKKMNSQFAVVIPGEIDKSDKSNNTESGGITSGDIVKSNDTPESSLKSDIKLSKTINDLINLNEIYFDFDKWDITKKAETELDKVVEIMNNDYPNMVIKIETHSDSRGGENYNLTLSQKRAESIYNYLLSKNISKNRILSYVGFGETRPVNNCKDGEDCSEDQYQKNRRSSFVIM
ncbi:putative repeat protein (TIGR01451 family) [Aquimarina sp. MAR_2010_214]|uniref:OmpA family protein n=1 Tax=Aquimarina sp. MAR_2010_214 TaxID=1250026 RepID=UPI000C70756D|nr:OmpA family protein [Aquimarina sp. MAR_2010_214]PKV51175.1 putative repeat protein (TIGR01451 family) [Aquimarina sp. MAR_2010_214]